MNFSWFFKFFTFKRFSMHSSEKEIFTIHYSTKISVYELQNFSRRRKKRNRVFNEKELQSLKPQYRKLTNVVYNLTWTLTVVVGYFISMQKLLTKMLEKTIPKPIPRFSLNIYNTVIATALFLHLWIYLLSQK